MYCVIPKCFGRHQSACSKILIKYTKLPYCVRPISVRCGLVQQHVQSKQLKPQEILSDFTQETWQYVIFY